MRLVLALCCAAHAFVGPQRSAPPRLQATAQEISAKTEGTETIFSLEEVQKILPHRYPFALVDKVCLLYTSPSPRDQRGSRMPSSA